MTRRFIPITDVAAEGLREDTASTQKLWTQLKNIRRASGGWKKRPGVDRIDAAGLPAVEIGSPKIFWVFKHPSSEAISELIRPNGTGNYDAWTNSEASNFAGIDESTADDDTTYIEEATKGDKSSVTFPNLSSTFNAISTIRVTVKAKQDANVRHTLKVGARISGVDYDFGTGSVTVEKGTDWQVLTIDSSTNPKTSAPWLVSEVNALEIILEKGAGVQVQTETLTLGSPPDTISKGGTQSYNNNPSLITWGNTPTTTVSVNYQENNSSDTRELSYELWDGTSRVTVSQLLEPSAVSTAASTVVVSHPFAPLTGTGVILRFLDGRTGGHKINSISIIREGSSADETATLRVTQLYVTVEGDGSGSKNNSLLMLTSKAFLRAAEDLSTYSDVQGSASAPTASEGATWDAAEFLGKVYFTNGKDDLFWYPDTGDVFNELSSQPVGRTIATYGSRLFIGDVTESSSRNPNKVRWSAIDDATNWTDASSGGRFLDETPGKVVALRPIVEQSQNLLGVLVGLKTTGIYHISITEDPSDPFIHKLMDGSAGCLSLGSVVNVSDRDGRDSLVFLGHVGGSLQVMRWNGATIEQFGTPVRNILDSEGDAINLQKSIGVVDNFGNYILLFPTTGGGFLNKAVVYNFPDQKWTTWEFGNVTAMGRWTPNTGRPITVLGRPDSFAYKFDDSISSDDYEGIDTAAYTDIMETGDLSMLPQEPWQRGVLERVWMFYKEDTSTAVWTVDGSSDGGVVYGLDEDTASEQIVLGGNKRVSLSRSSMRIPGRKQRVRIQSTLADGKPTLLQMILELEDAGTHPD